MIKSLIVFFASALAATAAVPQEWVGQWLMVNGILVLQIDADGKVTLRNTGQHDVADIQADKTFRFALGGKLQVAAITGDTLRLKNENPEAPSWLAQLEFRRATTEQASELLKFLPKHPAGALQAFSDVRRQALEKAMQNDARQLAAASQQILLETGTSSVSFTVDPATGKVSGPIGDYVKAISKGTSVVDGTYEVGGGFSLQNPDVYGGKVVSFDENGRKLP